MVWEGASLSYEEHVKRVARCDEGASSCEC